MPADFQVLATSHTRFTASDLDRSVAFFRDAPGFEVAVIDQGPEQRWQGGLPA